jgi:putative polysaccharide biosynthesis protein
VPSKLSIADHAERLVYRVAGLPVAMTVRGRANAAHGTDAVLDSAFAARYWRPADASGWIELIGGIIVSPFALVASCLWYTARNGPTVRSRGGKGLTRQFAEQLRLYFSAGVLAPWYYLFSLDEDGSSERARTFLQRFETKTSLFVLLKKHKGTPLNDKARFTQYCAAHGIRCVPVIASLDGKSRPAGLPDVDLFVKPNKGRGGRGAERWDRVAPFEYAGGAGERLSAAELLDRLETRSRRTPLVVQPRLQPHPGVLGLTAGALPTARIVTCLNEQGEPEVMIAVFRMSIGANRTVDNMHAGGIAAAPDIATGRLSRASDLGMDARLGWFTAHPDTGEQIEGRVLPCWEEAKALAIEAHRAFSDRVVVGWDIAILADGPILVEGNGNPDMDIIQRFMRVGLRRHRFGELIAWHLERRLSAR